MKFQKSHLISFRTFVKIRLMSKKLKNLVNVVYSTNPNFHYEEEQEETAETLSPSQQKLYVSIDRKQRAGKEVTLIEGFVGTDDDLKELAKMLKSKCGVGGSAKDNEIIVQGNFKDKVTEILIKSGYTQTKKKGGN